MNTFLRVVGVLVTLLGLWCMLDVYLAYKRYMTQCTSFTGGLELFFPAVGQRATQMCHESLMNADMFPALLISSVIGLFLVWVGYSTYTSCSVK